MNIDFHYGVIYVVARLGGLEPAQARTVAHACQYIDDSTVPGLLKFSGGETFDRLASAHKMLDYANTDNDQNRVTWVPFHFLPGAQGQTLEEKAICRPNSDVAKEMVRRALSERSATNALHRLGVTLHVYVDTWAHQGFSGIESDFNRIHSLQGHGHDHATWLAKLREMSQTALDNVEVRAIDLASGLGHGAALHFPDMPWAEWTYQDALGVEHRRHNLPDFVEAADMACRVVQAFVARSSGFESSAGLSAKAKEDLRQLLGTNQDHDEGKRFDVIRAQVAAGAIDGIREAIPEYIAKGPGSWKALATGIDAAHDDGHAKPEWTAAFEQSDYRYFHDAVKEHRFVVTQEILPAAGVRLA
ncbi:MAG: hypothetical protein JOY60_17345 [Burkholderiaceae bacterium]|nr:hypothetical protein [Burkholderiaceae bacterium]